MPKTRTCFTELVLKSATHLEHWRKAMKKSKLVMVGNGMAGVRTIEELLKVAPDLYDITVFGAEPHPNYNRILLSPVLAGEQTLDEIVLNSWDWYKDNHITLHAGKKVVEVDRVKRIVKADDGKGGSMEVEYGRLLLSPGAKAPVAVRARGKLVCSCLNVTDAAITRTVIPITPLAES
jgi:nitrite reductase (NADH) large subunit